MTDKNHRINETPHTAEAEHSAETLTRIGSTSSSTRHSKSPARSSRLSFTIMAVTTSGNGRNSGIPKESR